MYNKDARVKDYSIMGGSVTPSVIGLMIPRVKKEGGGERRWGTSPLKTTSSVGWRLRVSSRVTPPSSPIVITTDSGVIASLPSKVTNSSGVNPFIAASGVTSFIPKVARCSGVNPSLISTVGGASGVISLTPKVKSMVRWWWEGGRVRGRLGRSEGRKIKDQMGWREELTKRKDERSDQWGEWENEKDEEWRSHL